MDVLGLSNKMDRLHKDFSYAKERQGLVLVDADHRDKSFYQPSMKRTWSCSLRVLTLLPSQEMERVSLL